MKEEKLFRRNPQGKKPNLQKPWYVGLPGAPKQCVQWRWLTSCNRCPQIYDSLLDFGLFQAKTVTFLLFSCSALAMELTLSLEAGSRAFSGRMLEMMMNMESCLVAACVVEQLPIPLFAACPSSLLRLLKLQPCIGHAAWRRNVPCSLPVLLSLASAAGLPGLISNYRA